MPGTLVGVVNTACLRLPIGLRKEGPLFEAALLFLWTVVMCQRLFSALKTFNPFFRNSR